MNAPPSPGLGFKRQVVFRIGTEEWPLLEAAVTQHGSIQAAVLAGLGALAGDGAQLPVDEDGQPDAEARSSDATGPQARKRRKRTKVDARPAVTEVDEEIPAREAAAILGLKAGTVRGYIRSGRLPGRYSGEPDWAGWLTTRAAVNEYDRRR